MHFAGTVEVACFAPQVPVSRRQDGLDGSGGCSSVIGTGCIVVGLLTGGMRRNKVNKLKVHKTRRSLYFINLAGTVDPLGPYIGGGCW